MLSNQIALYQICSMCVLAVDKNFIVIKIKGQKTIE